MRPTTSRLRLRGNGEMAKAATAKRGPTTSPLEPGAETVNEEIALAGDVDLEDQPVVDPPRKRFDAQDDDGDDRKPAALEYEPDARDALAKNFAKARAVQGRELTTETEDEIAEDEAEERRAAGEEDDDGPDDPEVLIVKGPQSREVTTEPEAPKRKVVNLAPTDLVLMKVDGVDVEMTFAEMQRRAQTDAAVDNRLKTLNQALDEVRALKSAPAAPAQPQRPEERTVERPAEVASPAGQTNAEIRAKLIKVADSLQTDVPEKAADALEELRQLMTPSGQTNAVDVPSAVASALAEQRIEDAAKAELDQALFHVSTNYKDVIHDPDIGDMSYGRAHKVIVENLRAIGVPEEDLRQPPLTVIEGYAKLRQDARWADKLTPMKDVFEGVARATRKRFSGDENRPIGGGAPRAPAGGGGAEKPSGGNQPARIVISSSRTERKSGVTPQPRSASMRSDHSAPRVAKKDSSATIAGMREARG